MTDDRTLESVARSWLEEGPSRAPEHAIAGALARIQSTNQDAGLLARWRDTPMIARIAIAAALALLALAGAFAVGQVVENVSPVQIRSEGLGGPWLSVQEVGKPLPAATYYLSGAEFNARFSVQLPDGWAAADIRENHVELRNTRNGGLAGLRLVVLEKFYPEPCRTKDLRYVPLRLDGLIGALSSMRGIQVENLRDAVVGAVPAKTFTLVPFVEGGSTTCPRSDRLPLGTYQKTNDVFPPDEDFVIANGIAQPIWAVLVDGIRVLIVPEVRDDSSASVEAAEQMIASMWLMSWHADLPPLPGDTSLDRRFKSAVNDVSLAYPASWVVTPAMIRGEEDWIAVSGARLTVSLVPLGQNQTMSDWLATYMARRPGDCGERTPIQAGRTDAVLLEDNCPQSPGLSHIDTVSTAIAAANGHGYVFRFGTDSLDSTAWLETVLTTVEFPPE